MENRISKNLLRNLTFFLLTTLFLSGCGEEEIRLKAGPKLTRVINNFESVEKGLEDEQRLTQEEEARQKEIEKEYAKMMSPPVVTEGKVQKLSLVPSQNVISEGRRVGSIRFEGDSFSVEKLKEISIEVESKSSDGAYYLDSVNSLWRVNGSTVVFELPEHQKPSYVEDIPLAPIVIRTENFFLREGEFIKTDGRSLKIIADRVEIDGAIITTPLSTYSDSENGRNAGNLDIISSYSSFGPNHLLDVRGGQAGKLACAGSVLKKRSAQALKQAQKKVFDTYFSLDITSYPQVVASIQELDGPPRLEGQNSDIKWEQELARLELEVHPELGGENFSSSGVSSLLLREYALLWEAKKTLGGTDENDFEGRIYKEFFFKGIDLSFLFNKNNSAQARMDHIRSEWGSKFLAGWQDMIDYTYGEIDKKSGNQNENSKTDGFWIADGRVRLNSSLRKLRPVQKDSNTEVILYEEPLVVEGFRPGGDSGQVRIYSGLSFILPPSKILFDAGQNSVREKLDWKDYQDQVYGSREIPLYEDFQYMVAMQTWKNWSDKTYGPLLTMDSWGSFGKHKYDTVTFEVREDPTLPESVMTCEIADDTDRGEAKLPLRMDNQIILLPERVMEIGLSLEDVPESFTKASERQGKEDPAFKALKALKASKSGE